ncbi:MAG TPA: lytic transglycosylase domain-containing protein [Terriglobales bacterium]
MKSAVVLAFLGGSMLHASQRAVLRNGFSLVYDHQENQASVTRLYLSSASDTYIDVPSDQIVSVEKLTPQEEAAAVPPAAPPVVKPAKTLQQIVAESARRHSIDADFIHSVIAAESGGKAHAVSPKGAQGLMQLMPATAGKLGVSNRFDPEANVEAGTRYLGDLLARYHYDAQKALAAYNAGPGRVQQYHGVPPYRETQDYIRRIINDFNRRKRDSVSQKTTPAVPHSAQNSAAE